MPSGSLLLLFLLLALIPLAFSIEGLIFTTVAVHLNTPQPRCNETVLELDGVDHKPSCLTDDDKNMVFLVFNGTNAIDNQQNITLTLKITTGEATNYTGVFVPDRKDVNVVSYGSVTMEPVAAPTKEPPTTTTTTKGSTTTTLSSPPPTTPTPKKEAHLQISYIIMHNEVVKNVTKNGAAVTVAVIEGLALIAILVYFGYKTMVVHKTPQTTSLYGYDNTTSPRITIPDSIRMSDIPPPRDQNYATPPSITPQRTMVTSPELVVPSPTRTAPPPQNANNIVNSQQFNDPFASLDSW